MKSIDFAIAYKWKYDLDFVQHLEIECQNAGLSTYIIHEENIELVISQLNSNEIKFKVLLDRASDEDEAFQPIADLIAETETYIINHYDFVDDAIDKSSMHQKLLQENIIVPKTVIVPPLDDEPILKLSENDLQEIGIPFIIKPCYYSGGNEGVVLNARTLEEVHKARKENSDDSYMLQEVIMPKIENGKRFWLRCFNFFEQIIIHWWDDQTHIYSDVSSIEMDKFNLSRIEAVMRKIHSISQMDYFSSEFALTESNDLISIDYLNDQCDMRFQSKYIDGVPNKTVMAFINSIITKIKTL